VTATPSARIIPDGKYDLVLERTIDVPVELVWKAWTEPEHLKKWFAPRPWTTPECTLDLRIGGECRTVMMSPEGQKFPNVGCYLAIEPNSRLVFTSAMTGGFRLAPPDPAGFHFVGDIRMEKHGKGAKYTAIAMHGTAEDAAKHAAMGFHEGWGQCLTQLVEWATALK
jgi:uncharacterized protein YndB with AHSA1/START domain